MSELTKRENLLLIVCGGRKYRDKDRVWRVLDYVDKKRGIWGIVQGDAPGVDRFAKEWAIANGKECGSYPADWDGLGKRASHCAINA